MAVQGTVVIEADGTLMGVDMDTETGAELRRYRLPPDRQPLRVRLADSARETGRELELWQFRLDHVAVYGLAGAQLTILTNALTQARDAAAARDLAALQRWRQA